MSKSKCVKVALRIANEVLNRLRKAGFLRSNLKVKRVGEYLLIPVKEVSEAEVQRILKDVEFELCVDEFSEVVRGLSYRDILVRKYGLPKDLVDSLPRSFEIIGDVAIIKVKDGDALLRFGEHVAKAIMDVAKNVKAVYAEIPGLEGEFRIRKLKHLGGEERTETVHKEYGVSIVVDVAKTYYNASLSEEHRRVALEIRDGEVVADLFTGVGPFALHAAKLRNCTVYAIDKNPHAIMCLLKSLALNRLKGKVVAVNADVVDFLSIVCGEVFDKAIMNLPHSALMYVKDAWGKVRRGGTVYLYMLSDSEENAVSRVNDELSSIKGAAWDIAEVRKVIDYAPRKYIFRVSIVKLK